MSRTDGLTDAAIDENVVDPRGSALARARRRGESGAGVETRTSPSVAGGGPNFPVSRRARDTNAMTGALGCAPTERRTAEFVQQTSVFRAN